MSKTCGSCRFFSAFEGFFVLQCRLQPSVLVQDQGFPQWFFPDTKRGGWCGQHQTTDEEPALPAADDPGMRSCRGCGKAVVVGATLEMRHGPWCFACWAELKLEVVKIVDYSDGLRSVYHDMGQVLDLAERLMRPDENTRAMIARLRGWRHQLLAVLELVYSSTRPGD